MSNDIFEYDHEQHDIFAALGISDYQETVLSLVDRAMEAANGEIEAGNFNHVYETAINTIVDGADNDRVKYAALLQLGRAAAIGPDVLPQFTDVEVYQEVMPLLRETGQYSRDLEIILDHTTDPVSVFKIMKDHTAELMDPLARLMMGL